MRWRQPPRLKPAQSGASSEWQGGLGLSGHAQWPCPPAGRRRGLSSDSGPKAPKAPKSKAKHPDMTRRGRGTWGRRPVTPA